MPVDLAWLTGRYSERAGVGHLYENLAGYGDGGDCALVVYRNTRPGKVEPGTSRRNGETGQSEEVQLEADRNWWPVATARQTRLKAAGLGSRARRAG